MGVGWGKVWKMWKEGERRDVRERGIEREKAGKR